MHDERDDPLRAMFDADRVRLHAAAPVPAPAWRIVHAARARAAQRIARRVRWTWRIAVLLLGAGAIALAWHEPRALPGLLAPLLLGGFACLRDEPGPHREIRS